MTKTFHITYMSLLL